MAMFNSYAKLWEGKSQGKTYPDNVKYSFPPPQKLDFTIEKGAGTPAWHTRKMNAWILMQREQWPKRWCLRGPNSFIISSKGGFVAGTCDRIHLDPVRSSELFGLHFQNGIATCFSKRIVRLIYVKLFDWADRRQNVVSRHEHHLPGCSCCSSDIWLVVSNTLKNMSSSIGKMNFPINGKIKVMFQSPPTR